MKFLVLAARISAQLFLLIFKNPQKNLTVASAQRCPLIFKNPQKNLTSVLLFRLICRNHLKKVEIPVSQLGTAKKKISDALFPLLPSKGQQDHLQITLLTRRMTT